MRKLNLLIGLLIGLIILSCSSDNNNDDESPNEVTKLLKKITFSGTVNYSISFYYNSDNTINKMQSAGTGNDNIKQFYYNNGVLDRAEYQDLNGTPSGSLEKYIYSSGQLTERQDFYNNTTLDEKYVYTFSNNLISNIKYFGPNETQYSEQDIFQYDTNKNVISRKTDYIDNNFISDKELTFSYDNKKNPFLNFKPNIVLIDDFSSFYNNATIETKTDLSNSNIVYQKNYSYTYDNNDYVISRTDGTDTITYEYY